MSKRSAYGWLELVLGFLFIILGAWIFIEPVSALTGMVFVYGIVAVAVGIADVVLYVKVEKYTGFEPVLALVAGILSDMSGLMLIAYPQAGTMVLTILFPIWFIAHCASRLANLRSIKPVCGRGFVYCVLLINIVGLIMGVFMIVCPASSLAILRYFAGAYLILLGVDSILMAVSPVGKRRY